MRNKDLDPTMSIAAHPCSLLSSYVVDHDRLDDLSSELIETELTITVMLCALFLLFYS